MSIATRVVVLYEDQNNSLGSKPFGLHELMVALVSDVLGSSFYELRNCIQGLPLKGNAAVIGGLRSADAIGHGSWVLALLDEDRIREQAEVALPKASELAVIDKLLSITGTSTRRSVNLLVRNMESVVQAAAACDGSLDAGLVQLALRKKLNERDIVLNRIAYGPRPVRDCVAGKVPSLIELRDRIICALTAQSG